MTPTSSTVSDSFFLYATATTEIYTDGHPLSHHDALPIALLHHRKGLYPHQPKPVADNLPYSSGKEKSCRRCSRLVSDHHPQFEPVIAHIPESMKSRG